MLPIAIQIGSIIAGKVVAHGIYKLLKDQKYGSVKSKYLNLCIIRMKKKTKIKGEKNGYI